MAVDNSLLVRLGRVGVRVPGALFQRIIAGQARRSGRGLGWMTPQHHRVHDFAVTEIVRTGAALSPAQLAAGTGLAAAAAAALVADLERGKTFVYRSDGTNVDWAYPATAAETPHRVRFASGETLYAA
jgi:hypothetical protein